MTHERLSKAYDLVWDNDCVIYREHLSGSVTRIEIFNPFWEQLCCKTFVTGATDQQCAYIEKIMLNWLGVVND